MSGSSVPVTIRILDREYQIACREDERDALLAAADMVDTRMKEVRSRGNVIGTDRVAVMAALNMAHELIALKETEDTCERIRDRVGELQERVATALSE